MRLGMVFGVACVVAVCVAMVGCSAEEEATPAPSGEEGGAAAPSGEEGAATAPAFAEKLRPLIQAKMDAGITPGIMVYVEVPEQGTWIEGFGVSDLSAKTPMSPDLHHRIGSVTKTLTAQAVLMLADEGKIGLDDTVEKYLPGLVPNGDAITIRQLLNMTSGIFNYNEDDEFNRELDANPLRVWTPAEVIAIAFKHPAYFQPGEGYHYSNTNTELLGLIVERVSGQQLSEFMKKRIFERLGMQNTSMPAPEDNLLPAPHGRGYAFASNVGFGEAHKKALAGDSGVMFWPPDQPPLDRTNSSVSYAKSSGSVISTVGEMALWAKALGAGSLLQPHTFKEQVTWSPHGKYGLGISQDVGPLLGHSGTIPGYQTFVGYDPASQTTIVVFANNAAETKVPFVEAFPADNVAKIIAKELFAGQPMTSSAPAAPTPAPEGAPASEPSLAPKQLGSEVPKTELGQ